MKTVSDVLCFFMSFTVVLVVLTFVLRVPHIITQQPAIVDEYYLKGFTQNVPLDYFFVFVYFLIALFFIETFRVTSENMKIVIMAVSTVLITSAFCFYFQSYPVSKAFFSRWFHAAGYSASVYDMLLLVFTDHLYCFLHNKVAK